MADLLSAKQVEEEYGYSRSSLLRWEEEGQLSPQRTPGGHRRYDRMEIETMGKVTAVTPDDGVNYNSLLFAEWGETGLKQYGGAVYEERLKELRGRGGRLLKRQMRMNDPVIGAMFFGIVHALRQPSWYVQRTNDTGEEREKADFIEQSIDDMSLSWGNTLASIIEEMMEQGFALTETVYKLRNGWDNQPQSKYKDGKIGWRKWAIRPALSLATGREWMFDEHGGIQGVRQQPLTSFKDKRAKIVYETIPGLKRSDGVIEIPIEKLLHFRTTPHPANNPEGQPIHRSAYVPWWYKANIEQLEGIGIERDFNGLPVIYMGSGTTKSGTNNDYEKAKRLVRNLRVDEQAGVVFPHPKLNNDGRGILLEFAASPSRRSHNTTDIINRYNKLIATSVLAQFLFLGMDRVGSFALAKYQGDLFTLAISAWLNNIAEIINRHAVPKLLRYNGYSIDDGYPKLTHSPVGLPKLEEFAAFVNGMVESKVLTPDPELERYVREYSGLPPAVLEISAEKRQENLNPQNQLFGEGQGNTENNEDGDEDGSDGNDKYLTDLSEDTED